MQTSTGYSYGASVLERADGPFRGEMVRATNVLCPDGTRRTALPSGSGDADTFFSIPAFVYARSGGRTVRVYGYVTIDRVPDSDESTLRFVPYTHRKHADAVRHPARPDDATCLYCGRETIPAPFSGSRFRVHEWSAEMFCDADAARRSDWDSSDAQDVRARRTAMVRETQEYRVRTADEMLPLSDSSARRAELERMSR